MRRLKIQGPSAYARTRIAGFGFCNFREVLPALDRRPHFLHLGLMVGGTDRSFNAKTLGTHHLDRAEQGAEQIWAMTA